MKTTNKRFIIFSLLGVWVLALWWCSTNQPELDEGTGTVVQDTTTDYIVDASDMLDVNALLDPSSTWTLSAQEIRGLIQMREEEKLARDVYTTLWALWGNAIFTNIAASEQTHTNAVKWLLTKYGIADPVTVDTIGVFTSSTMQKLYTDLVAQWSTSLIDALIVGATIEDLDIYDLNILIKETNNSDIIQVYTNLNKWSRNHLRAYVKNINNKGASYSPQYISPSEYTEILWSQQERGNAGNGNGNKR
jgi:hypothetical protein